MGKSWPLFFFLLVSWTNCPELRVRTEPLYPSYLASNRIGTIDPCNICFFGEQIVVYYRFPKSNFGKKRLDLTIRFKDQSLCALTFPLSDRRGYWIHRLINEDYWARGGILSYKVELFEDEQIISAWRHHLFVDLIEIPHTQEDQVVSLKDLAPK